MPNKFRKNIKAIHVYLERRKARQFVGSLSRNNSEYVFTYDDIYLYKENSIALGPDLPLISKSFTNKNLFQSFADRIPSRQNPAYEEYCKMVEIDPSETDTFVLLATLGRKGPSSFIFVPISNDVLNSKDILNFRRELGLTIREFGEIFDFAPATINKIEKNKSSGKEAMKRLEIYYRFPQVALYEIEQNSFKLNDKKVKQLRKILKARIGGKLE